MLVLTRKIDEKINIGNDITVTVIKANNGSVKLGFEAPDDVGVSRIGPRKTSGAEKTYCPNDFKVGSENV